MFFIVVLCVFIWFFVDLYDDIVLVCIVRFLFNLFFLDNCWYVLIDKFVFVVVVVLVVVLKVGLVVLVVVLGVVGKIIVVIGVVVDV